MKSIKRCLRQKLKGYNTKLFTDKKFGINSITYNIVTKAMQDFPNWDKK